MDLDGGATSLWNRKARPWGRASESEQLAAACLRAHPLRATELRSGSKLRGDAELSFQ